VGGLRGNGDLDSMVPLTIGAEYRAEQREDAGRKGVGALAEVAQAHRRDHSHRRGRRNRRAGDPRRLGRFCYARRGYRCGRGDAIRA